MPSSGHPNAVLVGQVADYDADVAEEQTPEGLDRNDLAQPGTGVVPVEHIATAKLTEFLSRDPSELGFPPMLAFEIALQHEPIKDICAQYKISRPEWERIKVLPAFVLALREALRLTKYEGVGFRTKARVQAEMLLKTSWILIHATDTPHAVRADLIKWVGKMADYEPRPNVPGGGGNAFQINIHMGT